MSRSIALSLLVLFATLGIGAIVLPQSVAIIARPGHHGPLTDPIDFLAFYCGGKTLASGHDPYRAEPLRSCEKSAMLESKLRIVPYLVVPAPLPPYALALFASLARVAFRPACCIFFFGSICAIGISVALVHVLGRTSLWLVAAVVTVALGVGSLFIGQLVPYALVALCASAVALRSGRVTLAAFFALLTLVEPHVGLAVVAGLAVLERRSRVPLAIGLVALAAISIAAGGLALDLEYALRVIPAHARSEIGNFHAQYSLTAMLYALGLAPDLALREGEAWYVTMLACAIALARRLRARYDDAAFVVLTPPACAVVGGVFVHDHQMALALPVAFLLLRYAQRQTLVAIAIVALAIPWQSVFELFLAPYFPVHGGFAPVPVLARVGGPSRLAEDVWQAWIGLLDLRDGRSPVEMFAFKLPTWFAFVALGLAAIRPHSFPVVRTRPGLYPPSSRAALRSAIRR